MIKCSVIAVAVCVGMLMLSGVANDGLSACEYNLCTSATYGELSLNSIDQTLETHMYSFLAQAGDRVIIRMNRTYGTLEPKLELYNADGQRLALAGIGSYYAHILDAYLLDGQGYFFLCSDIDGPGRGGYAVSIQCTNRPSNATLIEFEDFERDSLAYFSEMKAYQFYALPGDAVMVQMIGIGEYMDPRLELFNPDGVRIGTSVDDYEAVIIKENLTDGGFYTILASDERSDETGAYFLILHRLPTDVDDETAVRPDDFALQQNYPNPFNPGTRIDFSLPRTADVTVNIYNVLGETICTLAAGSYPPGQHSLDWNGCDGEGAEVATGMYLYRLRAGDFAQTRKMILMR